MTIEKFEQSLAIMGQKQFFDTFTKPMVRGKLSREKYGKVEALYYKVHPELHTTVEKMQQTNTVQGKWDLLADHITPDPVMMQRADELREQMNQKVMTREEKVLEVLSDGEKHHSEEFNAAVGWDWRKPMSDVCKKYRVDKFPAGKYKFYQLIK